MIGIVSRNGGMLGVVNRVLPLASTPKRAQTIVGALGIAVFFDDYANTMIVGNTARPLTDRLGISREKLAYLVDSTAAPVSTVAIITTWIGFQVGLIDDAVRAIDDLSTPAYALFVNSIPYSFYPFLAVFFVFVIALSGKDFGPMHAAEARARARSPSDTAGQPALSSSGFDAKPGVNPKAYNALVPILTLIVGVIVGLWISGEGDTVQDIIGTADSYAALMWASLLAAMVAAVMSVASRALTLNETVDAWVVGAQFMLTGLMLLVLAWAVADVANALQTAPYLITILGDSLAPATLPAIVFVVAAGTAFATGTSWGVMAILMPLVIPLCWAVLTVNDMTSPEHLHILYSCIACVLTGAVWADHCSPISDTTVLSSLATGCDHMEHVRTQLPYAVLGGAVALVVGVLPAGFGAPWWLLLAIGAGVLFAIHRVIGKPV
jgi:Na+/H+ antiporter NhaC